MFAHGLRAAFLEDKSCKKSGDIHTTGGWYPPSLRGCPHGTAVRAVFWQGVGHNFFANYERSGSVLVTQNLQILYMSGLGEWSYLVQPDVAFNKRAVSRFLAAKSDCRRTITQPVTLNLQV